ncbi:hypothetical protein [Mesorhizobium sp. B2-4-17]|uniref:hypothetical protein n=1 Tax=Mesorhizobium sp. B2-4-17 TaxID=2589932 RepID=UPI00112C86A4|nr:hypothetical protein [Mesorhizobium sp. B2-4-17]TPK88282.1 hypothetical protein FJ548_13580 [Mesorhizobium sp. B2-4-17]
MDDNHPTPRRHRSSRTRVTNGKEILPGIDGRSRWARRLHDLMAAHVADLGGPGKVSQSQLSLIQNAATTTIILEKAQLAFAEADTINYADLIAFQTTLNSLRRTFEALGLDRVAPRRADLSTLDLSELDPTEQQRFRMFQHKMEEFGAHSLNEDQAKEMYRLLAKIAGRGVGPSSTDITPIERPYHEIDWTRR